MCLGILFIQATSRTLQVSPPLSYPKIPDLRLMITVLGASGLCVPAPNFPGSPLGLLLTHFLITIGWMWLSLLPVPVVGRVSNLKLYSLVFSPGSAYPLKLIIPHTVLPIVDIDRDTEWSPKHNNKSRNSWESAAEESAIGWIISYSSITCVFSDFPAAITWKSMLWGCILCR